MVSYGDCPRWRDRQTAGFALPKRRANWHVENQTATHRRLRRWRLPLFRKAPSGGISTPWSLQSRWLARPRRIHFVDPEQRSPIADDKITKAYQAARLHRKSSGRAQPMEHEAFVGMGAPVAAAGCRSAIRSFRGRPLPSWYKASSLATR